MAKLSHRFFALFFAILFLVTSSSVAIAFILSNIQSKDSSKNTGSTSTNQSVTADPTTNSGQKLSGFTPVSTVDQLKITDLTVGTGATVKPGATIDVEYTGAIASTGVIFQSSSSPISISLSDVIVGWQEGIPGMKVGGTRQLLIPANLAYGANPPSGSGIPANAALVFDVTVKSISSS